jgi:hypothetical protein
MCGGVYSIRVVGKQNICVSSFKHTPGVLRLHPHFLQVLAPGKTIHARLDQEEGDAMGSGLGLGVRARHNNDDVWLWCGVQEFNMGERSRVCQIKTTETKR